MYRWGIIHSLVMRLVTPAECSQQLLYIVGLRVTRFSFVSLLSYYYTGIPCRGYL